MLNTEKIISGGYLISDEFAYTLSKIYGVEVIR